MTTFRRIGVACEIAAWLLLLGVTLAMGGEKTPPWFACSADSIYITVPNEVKWQDRKYPVKTSELVDMGLGREFGRQIGSTTTYMPLFVCVHLHEQAPAPFAIEPDSITVTRGRKLIRAAGWDLAEPHSVVHAGEDDCFIVFFPMQDVSEAVGAVTVHSGGRAYELTKQSKLK